jgi:hypothetical protein
MQNVVTSPPQTVAWPWQPEDVRPTREVTIIAAHRKANLFSVRTILAWGICAVLCLGLALFIEQQLFRHELATQTQGIAQTSRAETHCLQQARTVLQQTACARTTAQAVTQLQTAFAQQWVPPGMGNSAVLLQNALDALSAAACYDNDTQTADQTCLRTMSVRLGQLAQEDAVAAEHG